MDALYAVAGTIDDYMQAGPGLVVALIYLTLVSIPVTLLHELGHAVTARDRLGGEVQVSVGTTGRLAQIRLGEIVATVNVLGHPGRAAGSATMDDRDATAKDILWIALAGPIASFIGLLFSSILYSAAPSSGFVHNVLWAAVAASVYGVLNLIPLKVRERRDGPILKSDGRLALDALKAARAYR